MLRLIYHSEVRALITFAIKCIHARRERDKGRVERRKDGRWITFAIWVTSARHLSHKRICLIGVSPSI